MEKKLKEVNYAFCDTCNNNDPKDRYGNTPKCDECLKHPYNENTEVPYNYDGPRPGDKGKR